MSEAGWPRPWVDWTPRDVTYLPKGDDHSTRRMPLPWVNDGGSFLVFVRDAQRAHHERLCAVCGETLKQVIVLGAVHEVFTPRTNGPGCHPRCFALALRFCPHFAARYGPDEVVAFVYRGWGRGYVLLEEDDPFSEDQMPVDPSAEPVTWNECRRLAITDPLGVNVESSYASSSVRCRSSSPQHAAR